MVARVGNRQEGFAESPVRGATEVVRACFRNKGDEKMKRSAWAALIVMVLSLAVLPLAVVKVNSGKEKIVITEEVLSGDPSAAAGITLETASHWDGHLFWDTVYTIGSGEEAESIFTFSAERLEWDWEEGRTAYVYSAAGAGFGSVRVAGAGDSGDGHITAGAGFGGAYTDIGIPVCPEDFPFPEIIRAVSDRTKSGETYTETVRIGDYVRNYPLDFGIGGSSVEYEGDAEENRDFLTELFHISTAEDCMNLTTEKDGEGILTGIKGRIAVEGDGILITDASTFGEAGCYYAYNCENPTSGKVADRGQNSGIFYLPFTWEEGWLAVDITRMRKVCELPENSLPEGMLLDEEEGYLYLTVREEENHFLCVYRLSGEAPVLEQELSIRGNERLMESADSERPRIWGGNLSSFPVLRQIRMVDDGLLITWNDNDFAFVTEEEGQWWLWCKGTFPDYAEQGYDEMVWETSFLGEQGYEVIREKPFPGEQGCVFDGERLVLAAFETWESLDVVVTVYGREGEIYCGLYRHSGRTDLYGETDLYGDTPYQEQLLPVGQDEWRFLDDRNSGELYIRGTDIPVEPLRVRFEEDFGGVLQQ